VAVLLKALTQPYICKRILIVDISECLTADSMYEYLMEYWIIFCSAETLALSVKSIFLSVYVEVAA